MNAYSHDLRLKVVQAYDHGEGSQRQLALRFNVSLSFVQDLMRLRRDTGDIRARRPVRKGREPRLDDNWLVKLKALDMAHPDDSIEELADRFAATYGVRVSRATMGRTLLQLGLTRKKRSAR